MPSVLFVLTSVDKTLTGAQTGWYLPDAVHAYYTISQQATVDFAAPKGANPPVDEGSVKDYANDEESVRFLNDPVVKEKLAKTKKISEVNVTEYDALYYVGGHGPVIDLPVDPDNITLIGQYWDAGKIVSAVCHGPAALVNAVDSTGKSILAGRNATGFSDEEEVMVNKVKDIPFLLEERVKQLGANYSKAPEPWRPKVVVDGKLITGQNPASAKPIAEAILKALAAKE